MNGAAMKRTKSDREKRATRARASSELSEEQLGAVSGGAAVAQGTGMSYAQQKVAYNPRSTPQARQQAIDGGKQRMAAAQQQFADFWKGFGKGFINATGIPGIVNGIKHHDAKEAVMGVVSVAANVVPGAGVIAKAGTTAATVAKTATNVLKGVDRGMEAGDALNKRKNK
jgi:hypothetical protein